MKNKISFLAILTLSFFVCGCESLLDAPKVIWGSSVRELEADRAHADKKTYFASFNDCYQTILDLAKIDPSAKLPVAKPYEIFSKDPIRGIIVVMGIKGNIDTTEVGIFLTENNDNTLTVEVASSSSSAQEKAAKIVFTELNKRFKSP
ncbi:MAG: hypothetical protein HQL24_09895 [Candidatus Omnitrophica bacterium]|nr:hypothetical protein [Candidatus Omnitrophota bacterium]